MEYKILFFQLNLIGMGHDGKIFNEICNHQPPASIQNAIQIYIKNTCNCDTNIIFCSKTVLFNNKYCAKISI